MMKTIETTVQDFELKYKQYQAICNADLKIVNKVVNKAIIALRALKMTMSGDDSGLINIWDEICVQIQRELSFDWWAYEHTIQSVVAAILKEKNIEFECDNDLFVDCEYDNYSDYRSMMIEKIYNSIDSKAMNYTNARIRKYLE